jgi:hypothetical protein
MKMRFPWLIILLLLLSPATLCAEVWVEYHTDRWNYKSSRAGKKLKFRNSYSYDADSVKTAANGDVRVWVREAAVNDRYYVGKGAAENEVLYKRLYLWCGLKKFELITDGESEGGEHQEMSDEIIPGSSNEKLYLRLCKEK